MQHPRNSGFRMYILLYPPHTWVALQGENLEWNRLTTKPTLDPESLVKFIFHLGVISMQNRNTAEQRMSSCLFSGSLHNSPCVAFCLLSMQALIYLGFPECFFLISTSDEFLTWNQCDVSWHGVKGWCLSVWTLATYINLTPRKYILKKSDLYIFLLFLFCTNLWPFPKTVILPDESPHNLPETTNGCLTGC